MSTRASALSIDGLRVVDADGRALVQGLSLEVRAGHVTALVGEPGAGAVVAGLALLDATANAEVSGEVRLGDDELLVLSPVQRRQVRGARMGAIFPDPRRAFDPELTLADNLLEIAVHGAGLEPGRARTTLTSELRDAGVPSPETTMYRRAGDLPTGILQRACVALAAACGCEVLVAESPTSQLDVLDAADVVELLARLARDRDVAVLLITEDVAQAATVADEILLMYAGEVHERGPAAELLTRPLGPYTRALLGSVPRLDLPLRNHRATPGTHPAAGDTAPGCRFAERCPFVEPLCRNKRPDVRSVDALEVRCHFADESTWPERLEAYHRSLA